MPYIPRSSASSKKGASAIPKIVKKKHTFRVFGFIASVMIAGAFLSIIGAFGYKFFLEQQLSQAKTTLEELSASETDLGDRIASVEAFHAKLSLAEYLVENHLAPSKLFEQLEANTKETVQYSSLTYTYDPGFQALLTLSAGTDEFNSVAVQNNEMLKGESVYTTYLLGGISNSVSVTQEGESSSEQSEETGDQPITFNVTGEVDTELIKYSGRGTSERLEEALPVQSGENTSPTETSDPQLESEEDVVEDTSPQELPQ